MLEQTTYCRARSPSTETDDVFVLLRDLPAYGIAFHSNYLRRMWEAGRFPRPVYLSQRKLAWRKSVLMAWLTEREQAAR